MIAAPTMVYCRRVGESLDLLCINSSCADISRMFAVSIVGAV